MKILVDECLPKKLKQELSMYTVLTVQEMGWSGMTNGELLRLAEIEFDVWLTADQNIEAQQNLKLFDIVVVVLVAPQTKLEYLVPLMPELHHILQEIKPHQLVYIEA